MVEGVTKYCQLAFWISREFIEVVENADNPKWMLEAWHAFLFLIFNKSNTVLPVAAWSVSLRLGISQMQCSHYHSEMQLNAVQGFYSLFFFKKKYNKI